MTSLSPNKVEQERLSVLMDLACDRAEEMFAALQVSLYRRGRFFGGPCPVHGGTNPTALNFYPDGHTERGRWACYTRGCHQHYRATLLGLVWGVLSRRGPTSFRKAVDWLSSFLETPLEDIDVSPEEMEKKNFVRQMARIGRVTLTKSMGWTREQVRSRLSIPPRYYLERGYSREVLDQFDVGLPLSKSSPMAGRVVVPVYDVHGKVVIGASSRSIHEECPRCHCHHPHSLSCPTSAEEQAFFPKWKHTDGFTRESSLYGYWQAREVIRKSGVVALCEGPGDVWRLAQAGAHNAVALYGTALSDEQQCLLESSGAMRIVVLTDQDDAGLNARKELRQLLGRTFRLSFPELPRKDVGEMNVVEVRSLLVPMLEKA